MASVHFTPALKRFQPDLEPVEVSGNNVAEVLAGVKKVYPGLMDYVLEENGSLRQHVNVFINSTFIRDRKKLGDSVQADDKVYIIQALSGG